VNTAASDLQARLGRVQGHLREDADNLNLLAEGVDLALQLGRLGEARAHAERALAIAPGEPGFLFRLAGVCIAERRLGDAEGILTELRRRGIQTGVVSYNLAYIHVLDERYDDAIALLREILGRPDCPPESEMLLVRALHAAGRVEEALEIAHARLQRDPEDAQALGAASLLHLDKGDIEQAGEAAGRALERNPQSLEALVADGSVALAGERGEAARRRFQRAVELNPREGRAWSGMALASMLGFDLPRALAEFRQAVAHMPGHIGTWHALAWCQILSKDLDGASATFDHALSLNRNFAESHGGRAVVAALQRRSEDAAQSAEVALRLDPGCISARFAQGILKGEMQNADSYQRLAEEVLRGRRGARGAEVRAMLARLQRRANRGKPTRH
jgi:tetratricopeptide (TPR) repeat protein